MLVYKSKYWRDRRHNETNAVDRVQGIGRACDELAKTAWRLGWIFENENDARTVGRDRVEQLGHLARSAEETAQNIKRCFDEWFGNPAWAELVAQVDAAYQAALSAHGDDARSPRAQVAGYRYEAARDEAGVTRLVLRRAARQQKWIGIKLAFDGKGPERPKMLRSRDEVKRFLGGA